VNHKGIPLSPRQRTLKRVRDSFLSRDLKNALKALEAGNTALVICDPQTVDTARHVSKMNAAADIRILTRGDDAMVSTNVYGAANERSVSEFLRGLPTLTLIVEQSNVFENASQIGEALFRLADGGSYHIIDKQSLESTDTRSRVLDDVLGVHAKNSSEWSRLFQDLRADNGRVVVTKQGDHYSQITEDVLSAEFASRNEWNWAHVVDRVPARAFESQSSVTMNMPEHAGRFRRRANLPTLRVRRYDDVVCAPHQIVYRDGILLPETFRQYRQPQPTSGQVRRLTPHYGQPRGRVAPESRLTGSFYYLDSEHVDIYGHLVTEVVGRLWAWGELKASIPDVKALVSSPAGDGTIPDWFRLTLNAFGIADDDIVVFDRPVQVSALYSATPLFANPHIVHPSITSIWARVRDALVAMDKDSAPPLGDKIFVSRRSTLSRRCHDEEELLALFESFDFEIFYPEDWPLPTQARVFSGSRVIAGYGGSGMLNSIYGRAGQTRIVIAPDTYNAMNEFLIASAFGDPVHYFWGHADIQHPSSGWSASAFKSDFSFDLRHEGSDLLPLLQGL